MNIHRSQHVDKSDLDENGEYDYYYEFEIFEFEEHGEKIVARSYADAPAEAYFIRIESKGKARTLVSDDLKTALFKGATRYLEEQGKSDIRWLSGKGMAGYEPV